MGDGRVGIGSAGPGAPPRDLDRRAARRTGADRRPQCRRQSGAGLRDDAYAAAPGEQRLEEWCGCGRMACTLTGCLRARRIWATSGRSMVTTCREPLPSEAFYYRSGSQPAHGGAADCDPPRAGGVRGTLCEFFSRVFPARPQGGNGIPPYKGAPATKQDWFHDEKGSVNESHE